MKLTVNGRQVRVTAPSKESLLAVLREELEMTGTKGGCTSQSCGACMVLLAGRATPSCAVTLDDVGEREVVTIEALSEPDGDMHAVQQSFLDEQVAQCGWCTPAQVLVGCALITEVSAPNVELVRERLSEVVCRCGTYQRAVAAVLRAAGPVPGGRR